MAKRKKPTKKPANVEALKKLLEGGPQPKTDAPAAPPLKSVEDDSVPPEAEPLRPLQERFCQEYLVDLNVTQAYQRAYPNSSYEAARSNGARLIANDRVQRRIAELMQERAARTELTLDAVIERLRRIGFRDVKGIFQEDGHLRTVDDIDEETRAAIAGVKVTTRNLGEGEVEHVAEIKLIDPVQPLLALGRHLGLKSKIEHDHKHSGAIDLVSLLAPQAPQPEEAAK